jgi:pimeloyl-ACP methyl ester carboxylesterase
VVLELPPLRHRQRDVLDLADHFLARPVVEHRISPKRLSDEARTALLAYPWPGNVRELQNTLQRLSLLAGNRAIGVALIESSSPDQLDEVPGFRAAYEEDKRDAKRELWKDRLRVWSGWERLIGDCSVPAKDYLGWVGQYNAMACRPDYVDTDECELSYFEESFKQAGRLTSLGRIPLLVISRDSDPRKAGMTKLQMAQQPVLAREQEAFKSLSPLSWRVVARNSGHMVPLDRPDVIVAEMTRLIDYLRGGPAPPFGSTATE